MPPYFISGSAGVWTVQFNYKILKESEMLMLWLILKYKVSFSSEARHIPKFLLVQNIPTAFLNTFLPEHSSSIEVDLGKPTFNMHGLIMIKNLLLYITVTNE